MLIVDSQVHIWAANTPERPWIGLDPSHKPHGRVAFTKDDLLREIDAAGVQRVVLNAPFWEGWRNDLALEAARLHPDRFAVMAKFDIDAPSARGQMASWRLQPGMLGVRINFKTQGNPADDWLWAEAEAAGVPIMMMLSPGQLHPIGEAAERHPGLKLVIDHFGIQRGSKDEAAFAHLDELLALAKRPNIAVKASGLPCYTTDSYPYRGLHPYLRRIHDAFGSKRMFWGTDFTNLPCTYRQAVTMFTEEMSWLTAEDKEWIMGRGLCEWIGWKLP